MILNKRQYRVTKGQISKLQSALAIARKGRNGIDPRVYKAMVAGIASQIEELRQQIAEFDEPQRAESLRLGSAGDLGQLLIKARVARGYTQKELADEVGIKPQQIQRYEAVAYQSASLQRVLEIMRALGLDLRASIDLK